MTTTNNPTLASMEHIMQAVREMDTPQLDAFVQEVLLLQAQRRPSHLSAEEGKLLDTINQRIAPASEQHYQQLVAKRQAQVITLAEWSELLRLSDENERRNAERLEALIELANRRGVSLDTLMREIGIRAHPYA